MLDILYDVLRSHDFQNSLSQPTLWDSLIINRRKPVTYRIFRQLGDIRVCLHCFSPCDEDEAFKHPHPWPGAFIILKGGYYMDLWRSKDREDTDPVKITSMYLTTLSEYEITDPLVWHSVVPTTTTYTVMVNKVPWPPEMQHASVRTTTGKDLKAMSASQLDKYLTRFRNLRAKYYF